MRNNFTTKDIGNKYKVVEENGAGVGVGAVVKLTRLAHPDVGIFTVLSGSELGCGKALMPWRVKLIKGNSMNKNDLKDGMIVEYRNGSLAMVYNGSLLSKQGLMKISSFSKYLTYGHCDSDYCIAKVFSPNSSAYNFDSMLSIKGSILLWKRNDKKDMTVEEIEKALGHNVRVVK